jgi:putative transposase
MFARDVSAVRVAERLRVSSKSAYQWRRRWRAGGQAALASTGPGGATCRLSPEQSVRLRAELELGPAAHGWREDQRWTLARITTLLTLGPSCSGQATTIGIPHTPGIDRSPTNITSPRRV